MYVPNIIPDQFVDETAVSQKVIQGVCPGATVAELDALAAQTAAAFSTQHPDYAILAGRIEISNLHRLTEERFSKVVSIFHHYKHPETGEPMPLVGKDMYDVVMKHKDLLDGVIRYDRDFDYDYFGFKTLERSYLLRLKGVVAERPQHMLMRVSVGIHMDNIDRVLETYHLLSQKFFTHATPTLFNAGTPKPQMSSCFLTGIKEDSIEGIYDTLKNCAVISKYAGGIGVSISNVRARHSFIRGTNGASNGIIPMLRVFNNTARYVDQGDGKRKGSIAAYIEPWHPDIFAFLDLRKNHGNEMERARDIFCALWVPDLFMERVETNGEWTLMCPRECPGLDSHWGNDFKDLYESYESKGRGRETIKARQLWFAILDSQVETGTPYMLYKDHCNSKSNQQHLGTIKCSNLCAEVVEYTSSGEIAVCNLASINLSKLAFPVDDFECKSVGAGFDFAQLKYIAGFVAKNLDTIIDRGFYPVKEAMTSNLRHRPIGIGVQGLADVFQVLKLPFESLEAAML